LASLRARPISPSFLSRSASASDSFERAVGVRPVDGRGASQPVDIGDAARCGTGRCAAPHLRAQQRAALRACPWCALATPALEHVDRFGDRLGPDQHAIDVQIVVRACRERTRTGSRSRRHRDQRRHDLDGAADIAGQRHPNTPYGMIRL